MGYKKGGLALFAVALTLATSAVAQEVKKEGVIVSHKENNLDVRTMEGPLTVVLTPTTTIKEVSGAFSEEDSRSARL